jgi:hypothetical protein
MPVWSMKRFISAIPPKGVTGLSEYSIGRFTIPVILAYSSIPWPDRFTASWLVFYCMIRVKVTNYGGRVSVPPNLVLSSSPMAINALPEASN